MYLEDQALRVLAPASLPHHFSRNRSVPRISISTACLADSSPRGVLGRVVPLRRSMSAIRFCDVLPVASNCWRPRSSRSRPRVNAENVRISVGISSPLAPAESEHSSKRSRCLAASLCIGKSRAHHFCRYLWVARVGVEHGHRNLSQTLFPVFDL